MLTVPMTTITSWGIPLSAFRQVRQLNKTYLALTNPVYCQVFWVNLWRNYLADRFAKQKMITHVAAINLDHTVYLDQHENMVLLQPTVQNILYYANHSDHVQPNTVSMFGMNAIVYLIMGIALIVVFIVVMVWRDIKKLNTPLFI